MDNVRLTHLGLLKYCELYPGPKMQYLNIKFRGGKSIFSCSVTTTYHSTHQHWCMNKIMESTNRRLIRIMILL